MLKLDKFVMIIAKNKRDDILPGPVAVPGMYNMWIISIWLI